MCVPSPRLGLNRRMGDAGGSLRRPNEPANATVAGRARTRRSPGSAEAVVIARVPSPGWMLGDWVPVKLVFADVLARQTRLSRSTADLRTGGARHLIGRIVERIEQAGP